MCLTGCAKYGQETVKPTISDLKVSETDTKAVLTSKTNEVITVSSGVGTQLIAYEGDFKNQTENFRKSILSSIETVINQCNTTYKYLDTFNAAESYVTKKENIMSLTVSLKENMENLKKAVNDKNMDEIKSLHTEYNNLIARLQTASL